MRAVYRSSAKSDMEYIRSKGSTDNLILNDGKMGAKMTEGVQCSPPYTTL